MRKSREFDDVLNDCLERMLVSGETVEQCLSTYPEHTEALRPLLDTALATSQAATIQPRPEFRDRARYQFYSALQEMERKRSRPFFSWRWQPRWVAAVVVVLALVLAGGGMVAVASGSMPDEPLYAVKLATEQVQLALTPTSLGKAELYTELADRRVSEIVDMADKSKPEQIELTARRLDAHLAEIAVLASAQGVGDGQNELTSAPPPEKASAAEEVLVAEEAPRATVEAPAAEEAPAVDEAPAVGQAPAVAPLPAPPPAPAEQPPDVQELSAEAARRAELRAVVMSQAVSQTERLRTVLETAPEAARPALLQAIAISEAGYERAIGSLD